MTKTLRANVVSRFLSAQGEERSKYHASRAVRGYGRYTRGFEVKGHENGAVKVEFVLGSHSGGSAEFRAQIHAEAMERMEKLLGERYDVKREQGLYGQEYLVVTYK